MTAHNIKRPDWLRKKTVLSPAFLKTRKKISDLGLSTVCESARCPNLSECFCEGAATFMILGKYCTRNCAFCAVDRGRPLDPDESEGEKIASFMQAMKIRFGVITSVTRDDQRDFGAHHFKRVVLDIKEALPDVKLELLVPDFGGRIDLIEMIASLPVEVFGHNLETVKSIYPLVRKEADYDRSLSLLKIAARVRGTGTLLKSGIMIGLGEGEDELGELFRDLAGCGVNILTIGQYLQPTLNNLPVKRYYSPIEFAFLKEKALAVGVENVISAPYVRSSYLAEKNYLYSLKKNV